ncbi:neural proliferation differentiation and control protein 1a isoform X1 [Callorhinchus milii]|nr:neural proliferation differentiation and control protein 1a isoform X1 [Callorhinchus milii]
MVMMMMMLGTLLGALALLRSSTAEPCPKHLECVIQRREVCPSGSSHCGPCLSHYVQNAKGNCERERNLQSGMSHGVSNIDAEIDHLAAVLANQQNPPSALQLAAKESTGPQNNLKEAPSDIKSNTAEPGFTTSAVTNTPNKLVIIKGGPQGTFVPASDAILLTLIIVCTVAGVSGLIVAGICWCRMQRELKLTQKADYQVYGMVGINAPTEKSLNGDKKLAHSAQMYHYQHQKQQMISMEKNKDESKVADSATESDGENEDGDFTVYECPGLAPTGEMEVKNPLFDDSSLHHSTSKTHQ